MSESETPRTRKHLHYTCDISMTEANLLIDYMNREENARAEFIAERDEALRELAEARKDAGRLDWAESQWADGLHIEACGEGSCSGDRVQKIATVYFGKSECTRRTIRAAIDAAMAADPPAK